MLVELSEVSARGQGEDEDEEEPVLTSQEGRLALAKLDSGSTVAGRFEFTEINRSLNVFPTPRIL